MTTTLPAPGGAKQPVASGRIRGLQCRECGELYPAEARHVCDLCFGPVEVAYDYEGIGRASSPFSALPEGEEPEHEVREA